MYNAYYLKFTDQAEAQTVLYRMEGVVEADAEMGIEANEGYEVPNFPNIDVIGEIYEGGEWDEEGNVIVEPTKLEGWHVNVLTKELAPELDNYSINVNSPYRTWAN